MRCTGAFTCRDGAAAGALLAAALGASAAGTVGAPGEVPLARGCAVRAAFAGGGTTARSETCPLVNTPCKGTVGALWRRCATRMAVGARGGGGGGAARTGAGVRGPLFAA